jgi:hypothetical protein
MKPSRLAVLALPLLVSLTACSSSSAPPALSLDDPALQEEVVVAVQGVESGLRESAKQLATSGVDGRHVSVVLDASARGVLAGDFTVRLMGVNNFAMVFWSDGGQKAVAEDLTNAQPYMEIEYKDVTACLRLSANGSTIDSVPATDQELREAPKASALVSFFGCAGMGSGNW